MEDVNDLRQMRESAGVSRNGMGRELGVTGPAISYIEQQEPTNPKFRLYRWAYYGVLSSMPGIRPKKPKKASTKK